MLHWKERSWKQTEVTGYALRVFTQKRGPFYQPDSDTPEVRFDKQISILYVFRPRGFGA